MNIRQAHDLANEGQGQWTLVGYVGDYSSMYRDSGLARIRHAMAHADGPTDWGHFDSEAQIKPEARVIQITGAYGYEAVLVRNDHPYMEGCSDSLPGNISPVDPNILETVQRELRLQFLEDWSPFTRQGYDNLHEAWIALPASVKDEIVSEAADFANHSSGLYDDTYWVYEPAEAAIIGEGDHRFVAEVARIMRNRRHESTSLTHEPFVEVVLSSDHGQYQPQIFADMVRAKSFKGTWHYIQDSQLDELLMGPDHEYYWETWESVCQSARFFHEKGQELHIHQDGDIFIVDCNATESDLKSFLL